MATFILVKNFCCNITKLRNRKLVCISINLRGWTDGGSSTYVSWRHYPSPWGLPGAALAAWQPPGPPSPCSWPVASPAGWWCPGRRNDGPQGYPQPVGGTWCPQTHISFHTSDIFLCGHGLLHFSVYESTTCDVETTTAHFPVPFGPIFQIFVLKFFSTFFSRSGNFLTVRDPPLWWKIWIFFLVQFW